MNYDPYHKPGQTPERLDDPDHRCPVSRGSRQDCPEVRLHPNLRNGKARVRVGSPHCPKLSALKCLFGDLESSKYRAATEEQMAKAIELANKYPNIVEYVIVGNECLDQDFADGAVSVDQLIADINKVKQSVPPNSR